MCYLLANQLGVAEYYEHQVVSRRINLGDDGGNRFGCCRVQAGAVFVDLRGAQTGGLKHREHIGELRGCFEPRRKLAHDVIAR